MFTVVSGEGQTSLRIITRGKYLGTRRKTCRVPSFYRKLKVVTESEKYCFEQLGGSNHATGHLDCETPL